MTDKQELEKVFDILANDIGADRAFAVMKIADECIGVGIKQANKAFADWLDEIRIDELAKGKTLNIENALSYLNRLIFKIEAKIKELRSNPFASKSVDGKRSEGKE